MVPIQTLDEKINVLKQKLNEGRKASEEGEGVTRPLRKKLKRLQRRRRVVRILEARTAVSQGKKIKADTKPLPEKEKVDKTPPPKGQKVKEAPQTAEQKLEETAQSEEKGEKTPQPKDEN